ncbi:MAG: hypothetical protein WAU07_01835, partial [Microgenomates group bacterium]
MRPRTYIKTFINSISSAEYYREVLNAPLWFSLRFFLISLFLIGVIETYFFLTKTVPLAEQILIETAEEAKANFPNDLMVSWNGSTLTSSNPILEISYPSSVNSQALELPNTLATLRTEVSTLSTQELEHIPSLLVITSSNVYIQDSEGNWKSRSLDSVLPPDESFVLTKENSASSIDVVTEAFQMIRGILLVLGTTIMVLIAIAGTLAILILESFLGFLLVRLYGVSLSLRQVFQLGLHIMVPAHIAHTVALFSLPEHTFPILS